MERVHLPYGPRAGFVVVREPCGHDEDSIADTGTAGAIALIDRLLVEAPGAVLAPGGAIELCAADRDRVLAALYRRMFGDAVESTVACQACGERFDLDFSLDALLDSLAATSAATRLDDGTFRLADRRRFRLPTGADELSILDLPADEAERELLRRCVVEGSAADDPAGILEAMRVVAPIVDLEIDATCPECRSAQAVHFDLQRYLLGRVTDERRTRAHEVHRLARAYGWSRAELLAMTRSARQLQVELVDREGGARWRAT